MRNYVGGWSSTYDSCLAQRAIVGYAVLRGFEIIEYNIRIDMTASSSLDFNYQPIIIVDQNLIQAQVRALQNVFGVVYLDGFGNGYALVQVKIRNSNISLSFVAEIFTINRRFFSSYEKY